MFNPEQDHISFTTPIFIDIQIHIKVKRLKTSKHINENHLSFNRTFLVVGGIPYHVAQITQRIITNMNAEKDHY